MNAETVASYDSWATWSQFHTAQCRMTYPWHDTSYSRVENLVTDAQKLHQKLTDMHYTPRWEKLAGFHCALSQRLLHSTRTNPLDFSYVVADMGFLPLQGDWLSLAMSTLWTRIILSCAMQVVALQWRGQIAWICKRSFQPANLSIPVEPVDALTKALWMTLKVPNRDIRKNVEPKPDDRC